MAATAVPYGPDARLDASMAVKLTMGGTPAFIDASMEATQREFSLRIIGERGEVYAPNYVKPQEDDRLIVTVDGKTREEHLGTVPTFTHQLRRIRSALLNGERDLVGLERSRRTIALIDSIYTASGLPVRRQ